MQENNNKKTLVLSILGVLVLVIAVVGVSFAMYSFSAAGQTTNTIQTGSVKVQYENETNHISLNNQYPMSDATAIALPDTATGNALKFDIKSEISGTINIVYDAAIVEFTAKYADGGADASAVLKPSDVKIQIKKGSEYKVGTATTGALLSTIAGEGGSPAVTELTTYVFDSGTFTSTATNSYVIKAWIRDDYDLPGQKALDGCSKYGYNTQSECTTAGGTWTEANANVAGVVSGDTIVHADETKAVIVSFKVRVVAHQIANA